MTVVLVCGGRNFATPEDKPNEDYVNERGYFLSRMDMLWEQKSPDLIVHGNAEGPDKLSGLYALDKECNVMVVPAKWATHGRSAGPKRNWEMLQLQHVDLVVAFPGGTGTKNMREQAEKAGIRVVNLQEDYEQWLKSR